MERQNRNQSERAIRRGYIYGFGYILLALAGLTFIPDTVHSEPATPSDRTDAAPFKFSCKNTSEHLLQTVTEKRPVTFKIRTTKNGTGSVLLTVLETADGQSIIDFNDKADENPSISYGELVAHPLVGLRQTINVDDNHRAVLSVSPNPAAKSHGFAVQAEMRCITVEQYAAESAMIKSLPQPQTSTVPSPTR